MSYSDSHDDLDLSSPSTISSISASDSPLHATTRATDITAADHYRHQHTSAPPQTPPPKRPRPRRRFESYSDSQSPPLPSPAPLTLQHLGLRIAPPSPILLEHPPPTLSPPPGSPPPGSPPPTETNLPPLSPLTFSHDEESPFPTPDDGFDGREALAQRLEELMAQLRGASVDGLNELHAKVDEMDEILGGRRRALRERGEQEMEEEEELLVLPGPIGQLSVIEEESLSEGQWEADAPEAVVRGIVETREESEVYERPDAKNVNWGVVAEANRMNAQLVQLAERLKSRQEESSHIQTMLVERAEAAAAHIMELEGRIVELEDEVSGNESDLRHLRIELRAVETLVHDFVPPEADPDLVQSIQNWKTDWAKLRERMLANKKSRRLRYGIGGNGESTILTPSISSISILGSPMK